MADNELVVSLPMKAIDIFAPGAAQNIVSEIEAKAKAEAAQYDASRPSGRAALVSLAHKVARSKTALDETGKRLTEEWRVRTNAVNEERRMIRERLDALKESIREPVTEYEQQEKNRIQAHEDALAEITALGDLSHGFDRQDIEHRIAAIEALPYRDWQEFLARANGEVARVSEILRSSLAAAIKRDEEQAELARLRAEAEARERKEREERIAAEAAERARKEAEAKAEAERLAVEQKARAERDAAARAAEESRLKIERAIAAAEAAEKAKAEAEEKAEREAAEAARQARMAREEAERVKIAAEREAAERETKLRAEAEEKAKAAAEAERAKIAAETKQKAYEAAVRERDIAHKTKVLALAKAAFMDNLGMDESLARAVVKLIHAGKVPHVKVEF